MPTTYRATFVSPMLACDSVNVRQSVSVRAAALTRESAIHLATLALAEKPIYASGADWALVRIEAV